MNIGFRRNGNQHSGNNSKSKHYTTEKMLYLFLFLLSLTIIGLSFLIGENSRWFTIVAGFGCSGIASVLVAWLLDVAACKRKEVSNTELLDHMFAHFDSTVQYELNCILESCAKRDSRVDLDKEYLIHDVGELLNNAEGNLPVWEKSYHNFGVSFASVEASLLLSNDPIPQHNEMYTIVKCAQDNFRAYEYMTSKFTIEQKQSQRSIAHIFLCGDVNGAERIFQLRQKTITCVISEDGKKYIRALRNNTVKNQILNEG